MRTNLDLAIFLIGGLLLYMGTKVLSDAQRKLEPEYRELVYKQKMASPLMFLLWLSPLAIGYVLILKFEYYAVEIFLVALFLFILQLAGSYLLGVRKLTNSGYPGSYINKYRISQGLMNLGILMIIGIQIVRLVQTYG